MTSKRDVMESFRNISTGTMGCSIRSLLTASMILQYIKWNDIKEIQNLADKIYAYYINNIKKNTEISMDEFYYICTNCERIFLSSKDEIGDMDLEYINYEYDDYEKYISFINYLNEKDKFNYKISNEFNKDYKQLKKNKIVHINN